MINKLRTRNEGDRTTQPNELDSLASFTLRPEETTYMLLPSIMLLIKQQENLFLKLDETLALPTEERSG
jgi:hypothetical protein